MRPLHSKQICLSMLKFYHFLKPAWSSLLVFQNLPEGCRPCCPAEVRRIIALSFWCSLALLPPFPWFMSRFLSVNVILLLLHCINSSVTVWVSWLYFMSSAPFPPSLSMSVSPCCCLYKRLINKTVTQYSTLTEIYSHIKHATDLKTRGSYIPLHAPLCMDTHR